MSETRTLLAKISALRQRLEQAQSLVSEARAAAAMLSDEPALPAAVHTATEHDLAVDAVVRSLVSTTQVERAPQLLSSRARRVLERGHDLLTQVRNLADSFLPEEGPPSSPLTFLYRETVTMIDTALRTVALLPDSIASQMHLCKGLELTLDDVSSRLRTLQAGQERQQHEFAQVEHLAAILIALESGQSLELEIVQVLADELLREAKACEPMRFLEGDPANLPHHVACHSLTVARVLARIVRHETDLRSRPHDVVIAGLLHDVGMLRVPAEVLANPEPLDVEQRRMIEAHTILGAQFIAANWPDAPWLTDAVMSHHERLDGTGYPDGLKGTRIRPLSRLLAVADVYCGLCAERPHRPARATRTALADTLLLAEQGQLDRNSAECLLALSFYPVGSVVEMAHGAVGVVVATPPRGEEPARPVVALLTDEQGQALPRPWHVDLGESDTYSIVRPLSFAERTELLGRRFPHWAA